MAILTYNKDWLKLDKANLRLLVMIMECGTFKGSLNDICDNLSLNKSSKNRAKIKTLLLQEEKDNRIVNSGLTINSNPNDIFELEVVPKEQVIQIDTDWIDLQKLRDISYSRSVSYETLLKVLLWIIDHNNRCKSNNNDNLFKGVIASDELNIDKSTFTDARKVLENDFNIFDTKLVYSDNYTADGYKQCVGQRVTAGAFNSTTTL